MYASFVPVFEMVHICVPLGIVNDATTDVETVVLAFARRPGMFIIGAPTLCPGRKKNNAPTRATTPTAMYIFLFMLLY